MNGGWFHAPISNDSYQDLLDSLIRDNYDHSVDSASLRQDPNKTRKMEEKVDDLHNHN